LLLAAVMFSAVASPGHVICVSDGGASLEWGFARPCAPVESALAAEAEASCGRCADVPIRAVEPTTSSNRSGQVQPSVVQAPGIANPVAPAAQVRSQPVACLGSLPEAIIRSVILVI
jgi:hypothetical protein